MTSFQRTTPPFRADHVDSLLRLQKLLDAREQWKSSNLSLEKLQAIEKVVQRLNNRPRKSLGFKHPMKYSSTLTLLHFNVESAILF